MLKLSLWLVILLVASCHARFVPSQNRNPTPSPEDALDTESASVEPTHKSPSASDFDVAGSAQGNPFAFGSAFGSDRDAMGDAVRDAFRMLGMFTSTQFFNFVPIQIDQNRSPAAFAWSMWFELPFFSTIWL